MPEHQGTACTEGQPWEEAAREWYLQVKVWVVRRTQACWHLELDLPDSQTVRNTFLLFKAPSRWYLLRSAWATNIQRAARTRKEVWKETPIPFQKKGSPASICTSDSGLQNWERIDSSCFQSPDLGKGILAHGHSQSYLYTRGQRQVRPPDWAPLLGGPYISQT